METVDGPAEFVEHACYKQNHRLRFVVEKLLHVPGCHKVQCWQDGLWLVSNRRNVELTIIIV